MGMFDLEEQFAFYGAYHSNPINIVVHMIFVWPILFTALLLLNFIPFFPQLSPIQLFGQSFLVLNYAFLYTVVYALYYVSLDRRAGSLAALLCFLSWAGSSALGHHLGFSLSWKFDRYHYFVEVLSHIDKIYCLEPSYKSQVGLASQLLCWTGQFIGHGVFEKRAPALLDNLAQAFLMAPFFVLLEGLQYGFGYEPSPGFQNRVKAKVDAEIKAWKESKLKKSS